MQDNLTHCRVILARPRGFCAGVVRAIDVVERALQLYGAPVYVRHEIVHNRQVVERLRGLGAVFVEDIGDVPVGAITVFSAHGVSKKVEAAAAGRQLDIIDATCPLVRRVHREGQDYAARGYEILLVGHGGHAEVEGTQGQIPVPVQVISTLADAEAIEVQNPDKVAYVTQTTLSLFDTQHIIAVLKRRFPAIAGPDTRDICYATQNRQRSVLDLAAQVGAVLVVGCANSSNASRLQQIAGETGVPSYLIETPAMIETSWFAGVSSIGITAGASTPETVVQDVVAHLATFLDIEVETMDGKQENVRFRVPDRLAAPRPTPATAKASLQPAE